MKNKGLIFSALLIMALLAGCATGSVYKTEFAKNHDKDILYKAALQSLIEMKFIITESDMNAGVISAVSAESNNFYSAVSKLSIVITDSKSLIYLSIAGSGPANDYSAAVAGRKIKNWYEVLSGKKTVQVKSEVQESTKNNVKAEKVEVNASSGVAAAAQNVQAGSKEETTAKDFKQLKAEIGGYILGSDRSIANLNTSRWENVEVKFIYYFGPNKKVYYKNFDSIRARKPVTVKIEELRDAEGTPAPKGTGKPDEIEIRAIIDGQNGIYNWTK